MIGHGSRLLRGDKRGNVAIVFALMLVPIIALGGAGIDLAQYETVRIELQDSLDRGVLAAASLKQNRDVEAVLKDYLTPLDYAENVDLTYTAETTLNSRRITAEAAYTVQTAFIHLVGVDRLTARATSTAEEARQNLEMSLMLDMSGSMINNNRIGNLKSAAKEFIDAILDDDTSEYTTISIVPYAGQVNVGADVFDILSSNRFQSYSSCFELGESNGAYGANPADFGKAEQLPHFTHWNYGRTDMRPWWCPLESTSITYLSNDAAVLKARIDSLEMHDGTGTQNAMQWGYTLLNPAARTVVEAAVKAGRMSKGFADRPAAFDDTGTQKVIVLMTDGQITEQFRPKDYARSPDLKPDNKQVSSAATNATRLANVCAAAKAKGITVFTIGFEIAANSTAEQQMRSCASTSNHYYATSGKGISDAFKSISASIKKLRLTQ